MRNVLVLLFLGVASGLIVPSSLPEALKELNALLEEVDKISANTAKTCSNNDSCEENASTPEHDQNNDSDHESILETTDEKDKKLQERSLIVITKKISSKWNRFKFLLNNYLPHPKFKTKYSYGFPTLSKDFRRTDHLNVFNSHKQTLYEFNDSEALQHKIVNKAKQNNLPHHNSNSIQRMKQTATNNEPDKSEHRPFIVMKYKDDDGVLHTKVVHLNQYNANVDTDIDEVNPFSKIPVQNQ